MTSQTKRSIKMTDERYLAALIRIKTLICKGVKLDADNSDYMGDKHNECTWGLCNDTKSAWPDAEDHLWPDQFIEHGRVAPLYTQAHQWCPLDKRMTDDAPESMNGCFYTCRVFQRSRKTLKKHGPMSKHLDYVVELYDKAIELIRKREDTKTEV
jgi:hypothetical protein